MGYPAIYPFYVSTNETVERVFNWAINGTPVDLTGYTAKMQVRWSANDTTVLINLTDTNGITLHANGDIFISIPFETMDSLREGLAQYDLELTAPLDGKVTPFIAGKFQIREGVTRL